MHYGREGCAWHGAWADLADDAPSWRFRLGVKADTGILDPPAAAELLSMHAPASVDDLLQDEHGPSLNALVEAALKSKQGH